MLFTPEPLRQSRAAIARESQAGKITEAEAGERLIDTDPDFGGGFLLLGNGKSEVGDLAAAESCYWKALDRMPCDYSAYLSLSDIRRRQHGPDDALSGRLMLLGIWKLALRTQIPGEVAEFFGERMKKLDLDFTDPATYEALAAALEDRGETPAEARDTLAPFELLNLLQRQSAEGIDADLLRDILSHSERSILLWRAALREWAQRQGALSIRAVGLVIALLGETAGAEILEDLLELLDFDEPTVFLHANWAVWRIGQRYPAETVARFRAAAAGAPVTLRCALADQIDLLPETSGIEEASIGLLDGFAGFAQEDDAAYLLAMTMETLKKLERADEAERVFRQLHGLLPNDHREWVRRKTDEGFTSHLTGEEFAGITIKEICSDLILMEDTEDEGVEEEEEIAAPVAAPVRPGRNERCWCGSGKKYKKCHLAADEELERSDRIGRPESSDTEPLHARLHRRLIDCDKQWRSKADMTEAALLYFGRRLEELGPQPDEALLGGFFEWYFHDFRPTSTGRTLLEEYLRRTGRLTAAERELLEAWRDARFGIWETQRIEEGKGVELRDLVAGDRVFVHDVSCSRSLVRWDCILSRIYRSDGRWYLAGIGISVPRTLLPGLMEQIERESREAGAPAAAFVRANSHRWHRVADEIARKQFAELRVVNAEGDDLEFSAAVYQVQDEAPLISALETVAPFEVEEGEAPGVRSFAWLEQGTDGPRRSYGRIEVRDGRLRLECNSRKRLEIGRQLVEQYGGAWLRHLGDSFQSLDAMKRKVREEKPRRKAEREPSLPPEVERELLSKIKREHYERWADERLPALGGRTPREAAGSEKGRRALEDLLRTMENAEERARREGDVAFDFSVVRKSLGM
jgi:tetratricopeptide (TPR) repeat protein